MRIEEAGSFGEYYPSWVRCMKDVYWFSGDRFWDYSRREESEELRRDFGDEGNVFLLAVRDDGGALGALGARFRGEVGTIRRWEPAVPAEHMGSGAGEALLRYVEASARERGIKKLRTNLRYPYGGGTPWCGSLYLGLGYRDPKPGIQLLADLCEEGLREAPRRIETTPCDGYTVDELAEFTLRAFASTPEDEAIHGADEKVSDPEVVKRVIEHQRGGGIGFTTPEMGRVALVEGEPAGFIRCSIVEEEHRPRFGLIAILGVFPEYRGRGIGYSLVAHALDEFKEHGCRYSYVGTPRNDRNALRVYEKAGFRPIFNISFYEKGLV